MAVVNMYGKTFQICDKPKKPGEKYLRKAPEWVGNPKRCSALQRQVGENLMKAVHNALKKYPANGTWSNLQKIRKEVAKQLKGKVVIPDLETFIETYKIPKSAVVGHPLVKTASTVFKVRPDEVVAKVAELRPLATAPEYSKIKVVA